MTTDDILLGVEGGDALLRSLVEERGGTFVHHMGRASRQERPGGGAVSGRGAFRALVMGCVAAAPWTLPAARAEEKPDPATLIATATEVTDAAVKAKRGDAATVKALKAARASLEPLAATLRAAHWALQGDDRDPKSSAVWNRLLTVAAFHGLDTRGAWVLDRSNLMRTGKGLYFGLPSGCGWQVKNHEFPDKESFFQHPGYVVQSAPDGTELRRIDFWQYNANTVYSGLRGADVQNFSGKMFEFDRDRVAKAGRKMSPKVTTCRLNAEYDKVWTYFVEGLDLDSRKRLRREPYWLREESHTRVLEVLTPTDPVPTDDPITAWQRTPDDPQLAAVLASVTPRSDTDPMARQPLR